MEEVLIAPCGINCGVCSGYLAMKNDLKNKGVKTYYCRGCLPRSKGCSSQKTGCEKLMNLSVRFCIECKEFPCAVNYQMDEVYRTNFHMSPIENLEYIKKYGVAKFLEKEEEKWRCPECGGVICCHNGICYSCGIEKLKNRKNKYRWTDD